LVRRVHQAKLNPATDEGGLVKPIAPAQGEAVLTRDRDHHAFKPSRTAAWQDHR